MSDDGDSSSPWTRPSVFLSIALLVFAIVAGSIVLVKSHRNSGPAAATLVSTPAVTTTAVSASPAPSPAPSTTATALPVTSTTAPEQMIPVTGPRASWITVAALALPTSPIYGPKVNDGTVMAGYQHSPTGALFAAADNDARFAVVSGWRAATLSAVADTPGRAAFLVQRAALGTITPTPGEFTQLAGFNYLSYTPAAAVIQMLSTEADGRYIVSVDKLVWQQNDWKILLPLDGQLPVGAVAQSTSGFVPWQDNR